MAVYLNRPIGDLLVRARGTLGMTQRTFGEALGASYRTAQRWDAGRAVPVVMQMRELAKLVFPHDASLAAEIAGAASETLASLGLVSAEPALPPIPRRLLIDAVVAATAEATKTYPSAARAGLHAALTQARALGVTLEELETAVTPANA